jgi:hypothetical protein
MHAYECQTCGKWHLGNPLSVRRNYPVDNKEQLVLELGERAVACLWDESYRDAAGRAYQVRKKVRSAQSRTAKQQTAGPKASPKPVGSDYDASLNRFQRTSSSSLFGRAVRRAGN